ncbi:mitochondrial mRNA pseudouridine synthase RPUSD3-like [Dermacentor albipictus]|uniref:mitochondrial mRNA pseudouridine synthase RPUSD3-like n=1 Tax=Dermacentor albipictus TaxID=60249 RepID=UPI0031FBB6EE
MKRLCVLALRSRRLSSLNLFRQLCAKANPASEGLPHSSRDDSENKKHVYRNLYPWKSKGEFVRDLAGSIFYNQDGLIALSKPYGVPLSFNFHKGGRSQSMLKQRLHVSGFGESPYSLEDAIEGLAVHLNVDQIIIIKSAERYASGVTILASNERAAQSARKAVLRAKPMQIPYTTAWIIAKGYPVRDEVKEKVAIRLVPVNESEKRVEVLREFSKTAAKTRLVKTVLVECKMLSKNTSMAMSLLQVAASNVHKSLLRAYVANLASCVMGDLSPNACLTKYHQGRPLVLSPMAAASAKPQPLPDAVCKQLGISNTQQQIVPAMVHYRSLLLPWYHGRDQHLLLSDPTLPRHFSWTLETLDLLPDLCPKK